MSQNCVENFKDNFLSKMSKFSLIWSVEIFFSDAGVPNRCNWLTKLYYLLWWVPLDVSIGHRVLYPFPYPLEEAWDQRGNDIIPPCEQNDWYMSMKTLPSAKPLNSSFTCNSRIRHNPCHQLCHLGYFYL